MDPSEIVNNQIEDNNRCRPRIDDSDNHSARIRASFRGHTNARGVLCIDVLESLQADLENLQAKLVTVVADRLNSLYFPKSGHSAFIW